MWGMPDDKQNAPADPYADTEPGPPDEGRDLVQDLARVLRAFRVCVGLEDLPDGQELWISW